MNNSNLLAILIKAQNYHDASTRYQHEEYYDHPISDEQINLIVGLAKKLPLNFNTSQSHKMFRDVIRFIKNIPNTPNTFAINDKELDSLLSITRNQYTPIEIKNQLLNLIDSLRLQFYLNNY